MFHGWDSFYLLIGPAAAALIGLLFVVTTLTVDIERSRARRGQSLYMTPTVFHFAVVVTASAMALVPEIGAKPAGVVLGGCAAAGLTYALSVAVRIGRGSKAPSEAAHWSDIWYYGIGPLAIYAALGESMAKVFTPARCPMIGTLRGARDSADVESIFLA